MLHASTLCAFLVSFMNFDKALKAPQGTALVLGAAAATSSPALARDCWFTRVSESEANLLAGERRAQPSASRQSCEARAMPWCCESSCLPATGPRSGSTPLGHTVAKCTRAVCEMQTRVVGS